MEFADFFSVMLVVFWAMQSDRKLKDIYFQSRIFLLLEEERGGEREKEEGEEGGRKDNVKITINFGSVDILPTGFVIEPKKI